MVKISVGLGMTLKMSTGDYNMFKPELTISDIEVLNESGEYDAEGIERQINAALPAADYAYSALEGKMVNVIETSEVTEKKEIVMEFRKEIADFKAYIKDHAENHVTDAKDSAVDTIAAESSTTEDSTSEDVKDDEDDDDW